MFADWILEMVDGEEGDGLGSRNSSALSATFLQHFVSLKVVHVSLVGTAHAHSPYPKVLVIQIFSRSDRGLHPPPTALNSFHTHLRYIKYI